VLNHLRLILRFFHRQIGAAVAVILCYVAIFIGVLPEQAR